METFNTDTIERHNIPAIMKMEAYRHVASTAPQPGKYWTRENTGIVYLSDEGLALAAGEAPRDKQMDVRDQTAAILHAFDPRMARKEEMMLHEKFGQ